MTNAPSESATKEPAAQVLRLFAHWQLSPAMQADLLGLSSMNVDALSRPLEADGASSASDFEVRAEHLLAIHRQLRLLFPQNRELAYRWMTAPNRAFHGQMPVDVARERGVEGLRSLRAYLSAAASA